MEALANGVFIVIDTKKGKKRKNEKKKKNVRDDRESLSLIHMEALADGVFIVIHTARACAALDEARQHHLLAALHQQHELHLYLKKRKKKKKENERTKNERRTKGKTKEKKDKEERQRRKKGGKVFARCGNVFSQCLLAAVLLLRPTGCFTTCVLFL